MAKDPAVLFYYQDFLVGTDFMTDEEVGIYIRILCHQADKGRLTKKHMLKICNNQKLPDVIAEKLKIDENGNYYNERMESEKEKRRKYAESRRKNRQGGKDMNNISKTYDKHMEGEDENINEEIQKIWITTWGRNPSMPEYELFKQEIFDKFGYKKSKQIMKEAELDGFKKLKTLVTSLNENGDIKPKEQSNVLEIKRG